MPERGSTLRRKWIAGIGVTVLVVLLGAGGFFWYYKSNARTREQILRQYMGLIEEGAYDKMYEMLDDQSKSYISREDFVERNKKIYEGIEASDIVITITSDEKDRALQYETEMMTAAGKLTFANQASFTKDGWSYTLQWDDGIIYPNMLRTDTIRVSSVAAVRGNIYDRDGGLLAGLGTVSSVGLVPGRMNEDPAADLERLAGLLDTTAESIQKKLDAGWVREDSFVPLRSLKKIPDIPALDDSPYAGIRELKEQLLEIPGVMITDAEDRVYPLGEKASLLIGYIQNISAEELEELSKKGYTSVSKLGKSGLELLYEDRLHGVDGCKIWIQSEDGKEKAVIASQEVRDGENITTTIDAKLQAAMYDAFSEDEAAGAAVNPCTGEVLALMSAPGYDDNDFILGMSEKKWQSINEDERQPMYNRFRAVWVPGSSFKPVTGAIGLGAGKLDAGEDLGRSGTSWKKDDTWGNYEITTLHEYEGPADLENALVYSDNIYFAKAALKIGAQTFSSGLDRLGFGEELPFPILMKKSQYINEDGNLDNEITLADSGYGQGQILVNPLHMACIYSAFVNGGDMIKPFLEKGQEPAVWVEAAFTPEAAETVKQDLIQVIENPGGTGRAAFREGITLAGKTGTAEIKNSKDDTTGTELGWFNIFTPDPAAQKPILLVTMVQDVKDRGGSAYSVEKTNQILDTWFE